MRTKVVENPIRPRNEPTSENPTRRPSECHERRHSESGNAVRSGLLPQSTGSAARSTIHRTNSRDPLKYGNTVEEVQWIVLRFHGPHTTSMASHHQHGLHHQPRAEGQSHARKRGARLPEPLQDEKHRG